MALTDDEVRAIWAAVSARVKGRVKAADATLERDRKTRLYPELWTGYNASIGQRHQILPHVEKGHFPEELFRSRAPNQTPEEHAYVRENYRQTTLNVYLDLENTVGRVWGGDWALTFAADEDGASAEAVTFADYVRGGVREWSSVENFARTALLRPKMADPMGVITVLPDEVAVIVDADGTERLDPEATVKPVPVYHTVENVWGFDYDRWYLIRLNETVDLGRNTRGLKLLLIDDTNVWSITQVGKASDFEFEITLSYPHGVGEPPCIHLMGVPQVIDGHLVWQSPYAAPAELLDIALIDAQYLQVSKVRTNYPQRVAVGERCDYIDTEHNCSCGGSGKLRWTGEDGKWTERTCPRCSGAGRVVPLGPMKDLIVLPPSDLGDSGSDKINALNAINYISPATDSMQFTRSEVDYNINAARAILHLHADDLMVGGDAKTATQSGLDNKSKDAFIRGIADQLFRIMGLILDYTARQMGAGEDAYTLRPPMQMDMRTLDDRLRELDAARTAGMPIIVQAKMMQELIATMYDDDESVMTALDAVGRADRLMYMPRDVIIAEQAAGRVQPWEALLHYAPMPLYDRALRELGTEAVGVDVAQTLADKMQELAKAEAPAATGTGTVDRFLSTITQ